MLFNFSCLFLFLSPGRRLYTRYSSCSSRSSSSRRRRRFSIHNGRPAGLQRSLGGVLQAAGCVLWTNRTAALRPASQSPAGTGWCSGLVEVLFLCVLIYLLTSHISPPNVCILDAVRVRGRRRDKEEGSEVLGQDRSLYSYILYPLQLEVKRFPTCEHHLDPFLIIMWTEPDAPVLRCWREGKDWLNSIISQSYSELPERRFKYSREPRSGYFINRVFSTSQSSRSPILKYSPSYPSVVLTDLHRAFRTIIMLCVRVCVCVRHRRRHASFDFLILVFCFLCRGLQGVSTRVYLGDCAQVRFMKRSPELQGSEARMWIMY